MEWLQQAQDLILDKEMIGYIGSVIILISLLMTNVYRLRQINLIGSLFFAVYGWLIGSLPVFVINLVISGIDIWHVFQLMRYSVFFDLSPVSSMGPEYLKRFFLFHESELMGYAPELTYEDLLEMQTCILFRNMQPVGLFAYRQNGADADIVLDFMIPEYRDFKAGRYLYTTKRMFFKEQGIKRFHAEVKHRSQPRYYSKNGFVREKGQPNRFVKVL
jgi:hypothetical protein